MKTVKNKSNTLIIILNWNGSKLTLDCCDSLASMTGNNIPDILIVDNNSVSSDYANLKNGLASKFFSNPDLIDNSLSHLKSLYCIESIDSFFSQSRNNIFLAKSLVNHGFSRGCNAGALIAQSMNYSHVLLLNNDTVVENDFLDKLFESESDADVLIPLICYFEPSTTIWNCGGSLSKFGRREYFYANKNLRDIDLPIKPFPISFATGCCMLMKTSFYIESGMFTEDFFFGEEDIDFSLRLQKMKSKLICVPQSKIYHKVGASLAGNIVKLRRKAHIHYLNRFINMRKHLGLLWSIWLIPAIFKMAANMKSVYKLSAMNNFSFCFKVLVASLSKNKVEKEYFEKIMNTGY